jgi:hypothetical protein
MVCKMKETKIAEKEHISKHRERATQQKKRKA